MSRSPVPASVDEDATITRITIKPAGQRWEVFPWDERGEAFAIPARTAAAVRAIVRELRQGRRGIPVTWLRS